MNKVLVTSVSLLILAGCVLGQGVAKNGIRKGSWRSGSVPKGWTVLNQGNYEFQSETSPEIVKKVAVHLNAMFRIYMKTFPSTRTLTSTFVVKIFKNRTNFLA